MKLRTQLGLNAVENNKIARNKFSTGSVKSGALTTT
jgi:hypothetical protein